MIRKIIDIMLICVLMLMTFNFNIAYAKIDSGGGVQKPSTSSSSSGSSSSPFAGAQNFIDTGEKQVDNALNETGLEDASNTIFNVVLGIAMIVAIVIGIVIGIKLMLASSSEKAEVKELLVPYVAGVTVVFGAIGIWKLAVTVFSGF